MPAVPVHSLDSDLHFAAERPSPIPTMSNWTIERSGAGLRVRGTYHDGVSMAQDGFTLTRVRAVALVDGKVCARLGQGRSVTLALGAAAGDGR